MQASPPSPSSSSTHPTISIVAHSEQGTHDIVSQVKRRLAVSSDLQQVVERRTKPQSRCPLWHQLRSYFGKIVKRKSTFETLAAQLTQKKFSSTSVPSLKWGIEQDVAFNLYIQKLHESHPTFQVVCSRLWIHAKRSLHASSPDGLIFDGNELGGTVDINFPFSAQEMGPIQAFQTLQSFPCQATEEKLFMKKNHDYFYPVQGQLDITHSKWCDCFLYTPHGFLSERIILRTHFGKVLIVS